MKRKLILFSVLLCLAAAVTVYAQSRLRSRGASVQITSTGGVSIAAFSGQSVAVSGNTAVTGTLTSSGLITANGGLTLGTDDLLTMDAGTASATAGAATSNKPTGVITSEALTTAAGATYTLTLTNSTVSAASRVMASVSNGTNTQGIPVVGRVTPASGSVVILVHNLHASEALNGTIKVAFVVIR